MTQEHPGPPTARREGAARRASRAPSAKRAADPRPLMTIPETAAYLKVSRDKVYLLIRAGKLRAVTVGERMRVHPTDLDAYLEQAS